MSGLELRGRIMPASNATFLADLEGREVVYKPVAGERPLWDFPTGSLANREVAAYRLSQASGWDIVPETWLGDGPHGPGMLQAWQSVDPDQDPVDLIPHGTVPSGWFAVLEGVDADDRTVTLIHEDTIALRRIAIFDVLINNADRKGGHVLAMPGGERYGIDHGVAFHHEPKLRTVLWGWAGSALDDAEIATVERIVKALRAELGTTLSELLTDSEIEATSRRAEDLLAGGVLPAPSGEWPAIPWPPF